MYTVYCIMYNRIPRVWVPGGRSRAAWAPSQGSWGASLGGGPGPKSAGRSHLDPLDFRVEIYVDFDVGFGSLWARSWIPLGGHFRSSWRLGRSKLVPEPSSNRLIIEQVILHELIRFPILLGQNGLQDGAKIDPRSCQGGSKIVLDRLFVILNFRFDF